jgi:uncharacterized protein
MAQKHWIGLLLIGFIGFLAGCRTASAPAANYPPEQVVPTDKSLLWRISGNGLKKPSYLYGTIHIIPKSQLDFSDAVLRSLDRTDKIVFEIDMKEMMNLRTQLGLLTKSFMKDGQTLKKLLSPEDYAYVHAQLAEKGLDSPMFERIKPMFLSMMVGNDESSTGTKTKKVKTTSVESELWKIAKKSKKKSGGLETAEYQMSVFDAIPYKEQAKMLVDALRSEEEVGAGNGENEMDKMLRMYHEQDITAMQALIADESDGMGNYEDIFLGRRNRNWIPIMSQMMTYQPVFFAVGAGHLGGENGVIALLRKSGYQVEAVF